MMGIFESLSPKTRNLYNKKYTFLSIEAITWKQFWEIPENLLYNLPSDYIYIPPKNITNKKTLNIIKKKNSLKFLNDTR